MTLPIRGKIERIGFATAQLVLGREAVPWKAPVTGLLELLGTDRGQPLHETRVTLVQYFSSPAGPAPFASDSRILLDRCVVRPGDVLRFPFTLDPTAEFAHRTVVSLEVTRRPGSGRERVLEQPVRILPPVPCLQMSDLVAQLVGSSVSHWTACDKNRGIAAYVVARGETRSVYRVITIGWREFRDLSSFQVVVKLPERTAADRLRSLVQSVQDRFTLRMDPADPEALRPLLAELLRPFIPRPPELRQLPIAATLEGPSPEALPRPGPASDFILD
jgi:hypothetical protein